MLYLKNQEVASLDEDAQFLQLLAVLRQVHHLRVDSVLGGRTYHTLKARDLVN